MLRFGELLDEFLAKYRSRGGTTYYAMITKRPREHFGHRPLAEITPGTLDRYLVRRRSEKTKTGERRISESTLR